MDFLFFKPILGYFDGFIKYYDILNVSGLMENSVFYKLNRNFEGGTAMRAWEPVEISVNRIDVDDIITTSFGSLDTPGVGGGDLISGSDSNDKMSGVKD